MPRPRLIHELRDQIGAIHLVPAAQRVSGPGASWVMAPFCHVSRDRPSRFSDGNYGVYYAGDRFEVALEETVYHFERFMAATDEEPTTADFRELVGSIDADLHDLRGADTFESALDAYDYIAAQSLARELRWNQDSNGIVYPSVRHPGGDALAVFWPNVVGIPVQGKTLVLSLEWTPGRCLAGIRRRKLAATAMTHSNDPQQ